MEFFDLTIFSEIFTMYLFYNVEFSTVIEYVNLELSYWMCVLIGAGILYLVCHILGAIGLQRIAKTLNIRGAWMAYVPFLNTYFTGKIAGETQFFGQKIKRAGLYAMLFEILYVGLQISTIVLTFCGLNHLDWHAIVDGELQSNYPLWFENASLYINAFSTLARCGLLIFFFALFFEFYRKFYARSPFLMTFLSAVLPFRGITIFAVRKNKPIDYAAYVRRRAEEYAQANHDDRNAPPDPFSDFGRGTRNDHGGSNTEHGHDDHDNTPPSPFSDF